MAVSPDDENLLYFPSVAFTMSRDGGTTVFQAGGGGGRGGAAAGGRGLPAGASAQAGRGAAAGAGAAEGAAPLSAPGGDNHDVWIDPTNGNRVLVANDSGVAISDNRAASYRHAMLPISQVYHVMADNAVPYNVMGNIQDKSSFRGPNRGGGGRGGMGVGNWMGTGGCEDAFAVPDPGHPHVSRLDRRWSDFYPPFCFLDARARVCSHVSLVPLAMSVPVQRYASSSDPSTGGSRGGRISA